MEHVLDHDHSSTWYWIQRFVAMTGVWSLMVDGCSFKDVGKIISTSKHFSSVTINKFYMDPTGSWVFKLLSPHIYGIAIK